jgi:hypothetical protein
MSVIDLTEDEHAALIAAARRAIDDDKYPLSPRLTPLKSALAKLDPAPRLNRDQSSRFPPGLVWAIGGGR